MGTRFTSKGARSNQPTNQPTPTLTPSGFLLLVRADPRSPIPERAARLRLAQPRTGWLSRGETPSVAMREGRGRKRGFRGVPKCPQTGFSGPWRRFRVRGGVLVFPAPRSWHHDPLLGSRESFPSPATRRTHPSSLATDRPWLSSARLSTAFPIPAALPPVNPAEKPPFPSFLPLSCPESRGCPSESSCNPMRNPMAVRRVFQL